MGRLQGVCNEVVKVVELAPSFQRATRGRVQVMRTPEASAIAHAITARRQGAECARRIDICDGDAEALAQRFAILAAGMTPADAVGEALIIGILAGRELRGGVRDGP